MPNMQRTHHLSSYYAPRGHDRMYALGMHLAQLYLSPTDKLIGVIGDAGSGKSALIRGMFPGLELTNDDDGVYVRPLPLLDQDSGYFTPHTFHVDIRFENGFTQMSVLAQAILDAINAGKRVVVEHFELVYPLLGMNAQLLISVGEMVSVTRPSILGPDPRQLSKVAFYSLRMRLMAHTAEDLCEYCIPPEDLARCGHGDVHHGFILSFPERPPEFDIVELETKVKEMIRQDLPVTYVDHEHVSLGGHIHRCTGPRIHVTSTGQISGFHLLYKFIYDKLNNSYLLLGAVGELSLKNLKKMEQQSEESSHSDMTQALF